MNRTDQRDVAYADASLDAQHEHGVPDGEPTVAVVHPVPISGPEPCRTPVLGVTTREHEVVLLAWSPGDPEPHELARLDHVSALDLCVNVGIAGEEVRRSTTEAHHRHSARRAGHGREEHAAEWRSSGPHDHQRRTPRAIGEPSASGPPRVGSVPVIPAEQHDPWCGWSDRVRNPRRPELGHCAGCGLYVRLPDTIPSPIRATSVGGSGR